MANLALNMIVKNEGLHLADALASVANIVDEIVLVDTGSTDDTKKIAKDFDCRILDFKWIDDFSAARNFALESTKSPWVFWLDGHDAVAKESCENLRQLKQRLSDELCAYRMMRHVHVSMSIHRKEPRVRLFPLHPKLRWRYHVHEQITPALAEMDIPVKDVAIDIRNLRIQNETDSLGKNQYYRTLLKKDVADFPNDPSPRRQLAESLFLLEDYDGALEQYAKYFDLLDTFDDYSTAQYVKCLFLVGDFEKGWQALNQAKEIRPTNIHLLHFEAMLDKTQGRFDKAFDLFQTIIELTKSGDPTHLSYDPKSFRVIALTELGYLYFEQGNQKKAKEFWNQALDEHSGYEKAVDGLNLLKDRTE